MSAEEMVAKKLQGLTETSRSHCDALLAVCKSRKATHTKELEYELGRYQKTMLREGVYSKDEVETLLSSLYTALQGTIQKELHAQTNLAAEFFAQLFQCAAAKGLSLDPPRIQGAVTSATPAFLQKESLLAKPKLASLESATSGDAKVNAELRAVEAENARHQEKIERITAQFQEMMQVKSEVSQELIDSREEVSKLKAEYGKDNPEETAALTSQIKKLKQENEMARKELAARLNDAPQFMNLKKMIAKKNTDLQQLREKLKQYELVYTAEEEDDY
eukprot:TRINITY_DN2028_c1_g2_i1.p1 TRINITY_DN2028_c1_g2~~TRINITY_DN2028_c1_g2_i1.p1  ORF type:complete len:302 (+),score=78.88 TRINITY_DN2028_c1_g2_i1:81-908(+)